MADPRTTSARVAGSAREMDAQCRGRERPSALGGEPGRGRGRALRSGVPSDVPVELPAGFPLYRSVGRPVVRAADGVGSRQPGAFQGDGHAARAALKVAAAEALSQDAADRLADARYLPATDRSARTPEAASAELIRLLDHLRATVTRFVLARRDAGTPIERVLPEVKGLVRAAVAYERWHDPAESLMAHVVGWTIAAYYDTRTQVAWSPEVVACAMGDGR